MTTHGISGSIFEDFAFGIRDQYALDTAAPSIKKDAWLAGRLKGLSQVALPSLRFRRVSGSIRPTTRVGPHKHILPDGKVIYFKSRYEDFANVEVEVRAKDWIQLEAIWASLLSAAWDVLGEYSTPGDYIHASEDTDDPDPEYQKGSQKLIQQFQWRILVPQTTDSGSMVILATVDSTHNLLNPDEPGTTSENSIIT